MPVGFNLAMSDDQPAHSDSHWYLSSRVQRGIRFPIF